MHTNKGTKISQTNVVNIMALVQQQNVIVGIMPSRVNINIHGVAKKQENQVTSHCQSKNVKILSVLVHYRVKYKSFF